MPVILNKYAMKTKFYLLILFVAALSAHLSANPIKGLLERIDRGASKKFIIELNTSTEKDFFELDQKGSKVVVRGNTYVNSTGWPCMASTCLWQL